MPAKKINEKDIKINEAVAGYLKTGTYGTAKSYGISPVEVQGRINDIKHGATKSPGRTQFFKDTGFVESDGFNYVLEHANDRAIIYGIKRHLADNRSKYRTGATYGGVAAGSAALATLLTLHFGGGDGVSQKDFDTYVSQNNTRLVNVEKKVEINSIKIDRNDFRTKINGNESFVLLGMPGATEDEKTYLVGVVKQNQEMEAGLKKTETTLDSLHKQIEGRIGSK
ncbi:MAG: hypothetical protein JW716_03470 [Candidatus Aenigmarchaeota archaeon]|nr:hypothetical protein [Candidatus Aenigmarchaeota archaeon]